MRKIEMSLAILLTVGACRPDSREVILTQHSYGMNKVSQLKFDLALDQTDDFVKFTLIDRATNLHFSPSFRMPTQTDSIIYLEDIEFKLIAKRSYEIDSSTYEVLKYEGDNKESTLFFNRDYGPLLIRGNHYNGHETYCRPSMKESALIDIIRSDSTGFGGI